MKIAQTFIQHDKRERKSFKSGSFYTATANVERNAMLNRSIIDLGGVFPWLLSCNNKEERRERAVSISMFFALAFLAPIITVPAANRLVMKHLTKLTKSLWSNNQKAIQLSNKYLTNKEATKEGLKALSQKAAASPLEYAWTKLRGKKLNNKLDVNELLKACGNDYEVLRKKLIISKNAVLCSDLLVTGFTLGSLGFVNNYMTKKKTGRAGFSAELEMADEKLIAHRADSYERNKKKRFASLAGLVLSISTLIPLALKKGLTSNSKTAFSTFIKKHAHYMDYEKGIFMSRLALLAGLIMNTGGLLLASRNKTELKDWTIRGAITNPVFFGGDLVLASGLYNLSDKLLKTKLCDKEEKPSLFRRIFPKTKSIEEINNLAEKGILKRKDKRAATSIYWANLAMVSAVLAYVVPTVVNRMIKSDVQKDVDKQHKGSGNLSQNTVQSNQLHTDSQLEETFPEFSKLIGRQN